MRINKFLGISEMKPTHNELVVLKKNIGYIIT